MHAIVISSLCIISFACFKAHGQTFSEWWQQKKTRIQYLKQQAIALQALRNTVEKGYQMATRGIQQISRLKNDEYGLHLNFFGLLAIANPAVANSPELSSCLTEQATLAELISDGIDRFTKSPWLTSDDLIGVFAIYNSAVKVIEEENRRLHTLITDSALKMTDGERLLAIRTIEDECNRLFLSIVLLEEHTDTLIEDRRSESGNIQKTLHLYQ